MKKMNGKISKTKTLGLLLAALVPTGAALADGGYHNGHRERGADVSGTVVVSKQIPGGVITVGATIGRPRPEVVVVEQRPVVVEQRKVVVIKQEERCAPQQVVIVREPPVQKKVVVIEKRGRHGKTVKKIVTVERDRHDHGRDRDRDHGRKHDRGHGKGHGQYHGDRQVSIDRQGPNGNYHYYEDAHQVSIDDNRDGQNRHVYVRK